MSSLHIFVYHHASSHAPFHLPFSLLLTLYARLKELGYQLGPEPSPIIATILDTPQEAIALWRGLLEHGIYVNLMLPPAAPEGKSLVRCSVSAAHSGEQIDFIGETFAVLRKTIFQH